jgi:hypothetical protein
MLPEQSIALEGETRSSPTTLVCGLGKDQARGDDVHSFEQFWNGGALKPVVPREAEDLLFLGVGEIRFSTEADEIFTFGGDRRVDEEGCGENKPQEKVDALRWERIEVDWESVELDIGHPPSLL